MNPFRPIFRRGPGKPPPFIAEIAKALDSLGLRTTPLTSAIQKTATPSIDPEPGERVVDRIAIAEGPPDALQVGILGAGSGHVGSGVATAYHALIRRDGLGESWPKGRVEAKRQFRAGQIGPARDFCWTASGGSSESGKAAKRLNALTAIRPDILRCLQRPQVFVLELAPMPDHRVLRLSLHVGGPPAVNIEDLSLLRDIAKSLFTAADDSTSES